MAKYIFMTGGVVSGIGKGLNAASLGRMLKDRGFSVFMQKFDPYLNVFPGLLNPIQHGEVFVTYDGGETDLDLGHYERFIDEKLTTDSSISAGKIYKMVFQREERGEYKGRTVQVIPNVTDQIKSKVYQVAKDSQADIIITEIGGTVGDIESLPFIEAIRQIYSENDKNDVIFVHTTLVPTVPGSDELKTKPTQHSYKQLMSYGIKPNIFILRSDKVISRDIYRKISLFCDIPTESIIQSENVKLIYEVPISLRKQGLDNQVMKLLNLDPKKDDFYKWEEMVEGFKNPEREIDVAMVGPYVELEDSYLSTNNALLDAGYNLSTKVNLHFIHPQDLYEDKLGEVLDKMDGIVFPSGRENDDPRPYFNVCKYARTNKIPTLGINSGQKVMAIEYYNEVIDNSKIDVNLDEITKYNIIVENKNKQRKIGESNINLKDGTLASQLYGQSSILERHRNEFEIDSDLKKELDDKGLIVSGYDEKTKSIEIMELGNHPFYVGVLYEPQYSSRPTRPHPIFTNFVNIALNK